MFGLRELWVGAADRPRTAQPATGLVKVADRHLGSIDSSFMAGD